MSTAKNQKKAVSQIPENPLQRIALCLSGGGYRAASFQLGAMSYLHKKLYDGKPLLENVSAVSTVSGGTFTGVFYSALTEEGVPFEEIYASLKEWLLKEDLVKKSLEKVSSDGTWNYAYKRKNIINAFAELYDETLTNGRTLDVFKNLGSKKLEFVCFNATEFNNGKGFRFQLGAPNNFLGAGGLRVSKDVYQHFRLGDIIAASSCFSGGFEPISMPNDFLDPASEAFKKLSSKPGYKDHAVGLMDGGIYDNQGIRSIKKYEEKVSPFDLVMICDVASPYLEDFEFTEEKSGGFREKTINDISKTTKRYTNFLFLIFMVSFLAGLVLLGIREPENTPFLVLGSIFTALGAVFLILFLFVKNKVKKLHKRAVDYVNKLIPDYFEKRIPSLDYKDIKIKRLEELALDRFHSLKLLLPNLFLKQIRNLIYENIYQDDSYKNRRVSCLVRELSKHDYDYKQKSNLDREFQLMRKHIPEHFQNESYEATIGSAIEFYAEEAANFGTGLWFTDTDQLEGKIKSLLISGQITCCLNLLMYLTELIHTEGNGFAKLPEAKQKELKRLHKVTLDDWLAFKKTPEMLYDAYNS